MDINKRKEQRFLFLRRLYELTGGSELERLQISEVARSLDIDRQEISNICQYLKGEHLADPMNMAISITHYGIIEVEAALSDPDKPTQYFPPVNIINVHNMEGSVIQQGNTDSTQAVHFEEKVKNDIGKFVTELKELLPELKLSEDNSNEICADINTIETQLGSGRPKQGIVKESLCSIKRILEGAAGAVTANQLLPYIPVLLASF